MRKIIPYILASIAALNLVWLFAFDYRIQDFFSNAVSHMAQSAPAEDAEPGEQEEEGTDAAAPAETAEQAEQETGQEAVTTANEETENVQEETPLETAEKTCRPTEGYAPNIRSGPGSDNDIIGSADADEIMTVRGDEEDGWLPIRTADGLEGYVFADMVEIIEPEEPLP